MKNHELELSGPRIEQQVMEEASAVEPRAEPFRHSYQEFSWLSANWDIAKLIKDLDAGVLTPKKITLDREFITSYAEHVLALVKADGADQKVFSVLMHVDVAEALALPKEALDEPVIFLHVKKNKGIIRFDERGELNHVLGDGNHRVAKAYLDDAPSLPAYVLTAAQSKRYQHK